MVEYARQYLNLIENYKVIWWKIFNAPVASRWKNVLVLVELLYCFPVANGTLERVFSQLKQIKDDFWCSLNESTLNELLRITVETPPFFQLACIRRSGFVVQRKGMENLAQGETQEKAQVQQ